MITTGCNGCCFFQQETEGGKCTIGQLCVVENKQVVAPGYCRMCRSNKWAKKQKTNNLSELVDFVIKDRFLQMDLIILFDEKRDGIKSLKRTLDTNWYGKYTQKIIIADVTGFGNRQNIALQYVKSNKPPVPIVVDSSVAHEPGNQREETIRRLSKQVKAPFFMVIPAGAVPSHFDGFAAMVQDLPSRVIHWSFPRMMYQTAIVGNYGEVFITAPYKALMKPIEMLPSPDEEMRVVAFSTRLKKEEVETKMGLSWFCGDCCLI